MNRRVELVKEWARGRRNGVSLPELMRVVCGKTCGALAQKKIESIREEDEYVVVYFRDIDEPLYYPKCFSWRSLCQVVAEVMYPDNWHCYEADETQIGSEDVVVDCGAAEGLFTLAAARRCAKVYAVEPLSVFADSLRLTCAPLDNVEVIQAALSDAPGVATLSCREGHEIGSYITEEGEGEQVRLTTVDALATESDRPISFIKADVEGYELNLLRGAAGVLRDYAPKLAITTYHRPSDAEQIAKYLRTVNPAYQIRVRGIEARGAPVMLYAHAA